MVGRRKLPESSLNCIFNVLLIGVQYTISLQWTDFGMKCIIDEFNMHLTFFQKKIHVDNYIDVVMGENNAFDKLIVMDDVSGLSD